MDEFIKMLNEDYELIDYRIKETIIVFEIASNKSNCTCPYCGTVSSRVHSNYQREIQDLPIQNNETIFFLTRFFQQFPFETYLQFRLTNLIL